MGEVSFIKDQNFLNKLYQNLFVQNKRLLKRCGFAGVSTDHEIILI